MGKITLTGVVKEENLCIQIHWCSKYIFDIKCNIKCNMSKIISFLFFFWTEEKVIKDPLTIELKCPLSQARATLYRYCRQELSLVNMSAILPCISYKQMFVKSNYSFKFYSFALQVLHFTKHIYCDFSNSALCLKEKIKGQTWNCPIFCPNASLICR